MAVTLQSESNLMLIWGDSRCLSINSVFLLADLVVVVEFAADCTFVTESWAFLFAYPSRHTSVVTSFTAIETNFCPVFFNFGYPVERSFLQLFKFRQYELMAAAAL